MINRENPIKIGRARDNTCVKLKLSAVVTSANVIHQFQDQKIDLKDYYYASIKRGYIV